jgi:citrate synthase
MAEQAGCCIEGNADCLHLKVYDPGFRNTAVRTSQTTHIDGNKGELSYRGYPISYLFENHSYEDVQHLLIWSAFPTPEQKRQSRINIAKEMNPDLSVLRVIEAFSPTAETYLMISSGLCAWAAANPSTIPVCAGERTYLGNTPGTDAAIYRSIAALMTVTAIVSCHKEHRTFCANPDPALSPIDNMLHMMHRVDASGNADAKISATLNKLWILFADHEMTNSTAAFLHASSTLSDPISSAASAILSAQGPLHAGAVDLAFKRLEEISLSAGGVKQHLEDVKAKKCRAMGVGHRVYRTIDPRTIYLKRLMSDFSAEFSRNPLLEVAMAIDDAVQHDEYFTSRKLCINADLYGSFVYAAL